LLSFRLHNAQTLQQEQLGVLFLQQILKSIKRN
jgi:hypothetical protein